MNTGTIDATVPEPVYRKCRIPPGQSGEWVVEPFECGKLHPTQEARRPEWARYEPGVFTQLRLGRTVYMSDLYSEWYMQKDAMIEAWRRGGRILVTGLGLGQIVNAVLSDPGRVDGITVVESSPDVIALSGPVLQAQWGDRLEIIHSDAFQWIPPAGMRFTVGWHDIWPNPYDSSILAEMDVLEERYAPFCEWQGSWARRWASGDRT